MSFTMEAPESVDVGAFLDEPGAYQFSVLTVNEQPTGRSGLIDGFQVEAAVLAGSVAGQEDRTIKLTFFNPKLTDTNNGEMAKKKQWRFAMAVGLIGGPKKPGEQATINLQDAIGRQFIARVAFDNRDSERKFLQLNFADIWHVDDPAAPKFKLHEGALKLLPKELRRAPESFKVAANGSTNGNGNQGGASKPAPPPPSDINVDDI